MSDGGYVDVEFFGGPYDGAERLLPESYRESMVIELVDPTLVDSVLYTGPMHRYELEEADEGDGLIGRYRP